MAKLEIYRTSDEIEFINGLFERNRPAFRNYTSLILDGRKIFDYCDVCHVDVGEVKQFIHNKQKEDQMQQLAIRCAAVRKDASFP